MKHRLALVGPLAAALVASACCIGPAILGALGLGVVGFAVALEPYRPFFLVLTAVLLGAGFYLAYRPLRASACAPGGSCAPDESRRGLRVGLWIVTAIAFLLAVFPLWAGSSPDRKISHYSRATSIVTLDVAGMTCEGCETTIEKRLREVPGVVGTDANHEQGRAIVTLASPAADTSALIEAVESAGYRARVGH